METHPDEGRRWWHPVPEILAVSFTSSILWFPWLYDLVPLWFVSGYISVPLTVILVVSWLYYDWDAPARGGRNTYGWWLNRKEGYLVSRWVARYFPVTVIKAEGAKVEPTRNYIMDMHPHGFNMSASSGAFYGGQMLRAFPDASFKGAVAPMYFGSPVMRELLMRLGGINAEEDSLRSVLEAPGRGVVTVLFSGSREEMCRLRSDVYTVYLKRRGFCRIALLEGAHLIPVLIFGENLAFRMPLRSLRDWLYRKWGILSFCIVGRGFFQNYVGALPMRVPHLYVVGPPIEAIKTVDPTREQVEELHARYAAAVRQLYEEYAPKYSSNVLPLVLET